MNLRLLVLGITIIGCLLYGCEDKKDEGQSKPISATRPNIILFVADDHGTDALGAYGNNVIKTPNLDQLAREGVRFNNAYCTTASCAASRSPSEVTMPSIALLGRRHE